MRGSYPIALLGLLVKNKCLTKEFWHRKLLANTGLCFKKIPENQKPGDSARRKVMVVRLNLISLEDV
jgi:hypothetical protein